MQVVLHLWCPSRSRRQGASYRQAQLPRRIRNGATDDAALSIMGLSTLGCKGHTKPKPRTPLGRSERGSHDLEARRNHGQITPSYSRCELTGPVDKAILWYSWVWG